MNTFKTLFLTFVTLSWTSYSQQSNQTIAALNIENSIKVDFPRPHNAPYNIMFDIETTENNTNYLVISMELYNDSYFVSPNAKGNFKGKFYMDLGTYTDINFDGTITETPLSAIDVESQVNLVRKNTTYKQALKLKSKGDFEVFGRVRFTIEPRCTLEEIPFGIIRKNGVLKITSPKC